MLHRSDQRRVRDDEELRRLPGKVTGRRDSSAILAGSPQNDGGTGLVRRGRCLVAGVDPITESEVQNHKHLRCRKREQFDRHSSSLCRADRANSFIRLHSASKLAGRTLTQRPADVYGMANFVPPACIERKRFAFEMPKVGGIVWAILGKGLPCSGPSRPVCRPTTYRWLEDRRSRGMLWPQLEKHEGGGDGGEDGQRGGSE